jgi:hypothetical protein
MRREISFETSLRSMERWENRHHVMDEVLLPACTSCGRPRDNLGVEGSTNFNPRFAESRMRAEAIVRAQASYMACPCGSRAVWIGTLDEYDAMCDAYLQASDAVDTVILARDLLGILFASLAVDT